jgi:O-acetyl-ADP-ribose deacetylase (regulator of RNase III)
MQRWKIGDGHLFIREGDITTLDVDCIVNAANSRLLGGGGVDGAIHRAAGLAELQAACRKIIADIGQLPPGQAVITHGFALPARHIIHTAGPIWHGGSQGEAEHLARCHRASMELAKAHGLATIAFPAISCGVYGYPVAEAARTALTVIRQGLLDGLVSEAMVVLHGPQSFQSWTEAARDVL